MKSLYKKIAEPYAQKFREPSDHIDSFLNRLPAGAGILDAGCGPGIDSAYMSRLGFSVTGLDFSHEMLAIARNNSPHTDFHESDLRQIDFPAGTFDGIIASYSLIHLEKKETPGVLEDFFVLLKKGGVLMLGLQTGPSEETYIDEPLHPGLQIFLNIYEPEEIITLLTQTGFQILEIFERESECPEELAFGKLCLIARKSS